MAHDLIFQDDTLQAIFYGNITSVPNPPSRLVNIFVSSTKTDMEHERRTLQESIVPNLQREWSSLGVDIQLVDIQAGCEDDALLIPGAVANHLEDIENCHKTSLGCFFLCFIGNKYRPYSLPASIDETEYKHLYNAANEAGLDVSLLDNRYLLDSNLIPPRYVLQPSSCGGNTDNRKADCQTKANDDSIDGGWADEEEKLIRIIQYGARISAEEGLIKPQSNDRTVSYLMSGVHTHLRHALKICKGESDRILCVVRQFEGIDLQDAAAPTFVDISSQDNSSIDEESAAGLQELLEDIIFNVSKKSVAFYSIPWSSSGVDPTISDHSTYLKKFTEFITNKLNEVVTTATSEWSAKWEIFPPVYRKSVQEVMRESQSQLLNSRRYVLELGVSQSLGSDCGQLLQIQQLMIENDEKVRHAPIIVCGSEGCGKSTLLSQVVMYCPEWLGGDVIRIVRHVGQSPCSTYTSELLRYLCLHISLVFDFEISPKHQSYELGKLSIWFQDLLKVVEETPTDLVIVLDDLQKLRSPPSNQAAILGWLPWNLPPNVHIVCSISQDAETILGLLRSRMPSGDNFVQIPTLSCASAMNMLQSNLKDRKHTLSAGQMESIRNRLSDRCPSPLYIKLLSRVAERWPSWKETSKLLVPSTLEEVVDLVLADLKEKYGYRTIRKVATFLACTTYGLRENELIELLASTMESVDDSHKQSLRPTTWFTTVKEMKALLKEYYVDRRPYLHWSHKTISEYIRKRYLRTSKDLQACYGELASAFHLGFLMEKEKDDANAAKDRRKSDWCDILREIDELWFHLLQSADREKLKQEAVCNFDFLQSAINGASISYIRSILELVKCQALDWEVELLSAVTKQAVDILSQDPSQLATELLNWLKCFSDTSDSQSLKNLVTNALRHSNRCTKPLLVPTNSWLSLSLPPQVTQMTCPGPVLHMVTTPDNQYVFCASDAKEINMYHLPSKNLEKTFKGHKAVITCLHVTSSGQFLISGSEDTDVLVWQIDTGQIKQKMSHHIAGVLCVTTTHSEKLVLSGSEIGVVVVANMDDGEVIQRLEKHRGVINCICVNSGDDIFATGSSDKTVCVWNVEDFSLLNSISLTAQIYRMDISRDSTFLVIACDDKSLHVRSLTTGSEVHCLQGVGADVTAVKFAYDNCRCVVGCRDGKCHIFDIHSASLITTLTGHTDEVSSVQVQPKDTFLVTSGGNKIIVWNFSTPKREHRNHAKQKVKRTDSHREPIICAAVSRDGNYAVSGSKDNYLKIWNMATGEVSETLEGHSGPVTCVTFSHNGLYIVSGSEDTDAKVWGLTLKQVETTFKEHQCKIVGVSVASDNRRVLSMDVQNNHRLWVADTGSQIYVCSKPTFLSSLHGNTVFAVTGKHDNSLKFWSVMDVDNEKLVSHSDAVLCYTITYDCQMVVTGSQDMSLKVWEVPTGKLTQVLAGHEGSVTCVAVTPLSPSLVVSGSTDCTLIIWDMLTGSDNFTLRGHKDTVKCVALTPDGSIAISGSTDNTIQTWNTQTGERVGMIDLHAPFKTMTTSLNVSQICVQLTNSSFLPILRLHNNPAKSITVDMLPGFGIQDDTKPLGLGGKGGMLPKRVLQRGNLKREQSFDSLYWELKAGTAKHELLTSYDDMRKTAVFPFSPGGGIGGAPGVWDGTKVRSPIRPLDSGASQPKTKLAKQKLLKKQQSMFAFFPVHNQQQPSPGARDLESRKADFLARLQSANKQLELLKTAVEDATKNGKDQHEGEGNEAIVSAICAIT